MGEFYASVQVFAGKANPDDLIPEVVEAMRVYAIGLGLDETENVDDTDRDLIVGPGRGTRWISVYGNDRDLPALAEMLSAKFKTYAIIFTVHDGDVLEMELFKHGKQVDQFNSFPGYGYDEEPSPDEKKHAAGQPERWEDVLMQGASVGELRSVWASENRSLYDGEVMSGSMDLLGLSIDSVGTSLRYLLKDTGPASPGLIRMGFRSKVPPPYRIRVEGPVVFDPPFFATRVYTRSGKPFDFHLYARNMGGAAQGLDVLVWGPAIDTGLARIDGVRVVCFENESEIEAPVTHETIKTPEGPQEAWTCHLDDFEIPQGIAARENDAGIWHEKSWEAVARNQIFVMPRATALKKGTAALTFVVAPRANPVEGLAKAKITVIAE